MPKGHSRVTAICNWLYDNIDYRRSSSNEQTAADESLLLRAGVCRDFAHLGIAFCRALCIPARFVSCDAYGLEPRDFHAVFEAYLDGRWLKLDATIPAEVAKAKGKPYVRDYDGVHDIPTVEGPIIKENGSFADYPEDVARWYEQMAKETMAALDSSSSKARTAGDDAFWTGPQAEALKKG